MTKNTPWRLFALLSVAGLLLFNYFYHSGYAVDDAYISFRYLDNLLNGAGLVFNVDERVEGYTNLLWILLLIPLRLLGLSPETAALMLNIFCTVLLFLGVYHAARHLSDGKTQAGWIAVILLAGFGSLAFWIGAGLETVCVTTLIAGANYLVIKRRGISTLSGLLFGAAAITRPDAVIFAAVAFLVYLPYGSGFKSRYLYDYARVVLVFLVLPVAQLGFRWIYYGELLPNTYFAKIHPDAELMWRFGFAYFKRFEYAGGILLTLLPVIGLLIAAYRDKARLALLLFGQSVLFVLYVIKVGGDYMLYFRFFIPIVPGLAVLSAVALWQLGQHLPYASMTTTLLALGIGMGATLMLLKADDVRYAPGIRNGHEDNALLADWLGNNFPPNTVLALNHVGVIPYRTGMPVIDMLGLNDHHIARAKVARMRPNLKTYIGHIKYDGDYVCEKKPDIVITTVVSLHPAANANEALADTIEAGFDGDREFLANKDCASNYFPFVKELVPGKFVVMFLNNSHRSRVRIT